MTRWGRDQTEFTVRLSFDGRNSMSCRIPKPILDLLGDPDMLTFKLEGGKITVG